MDNKINKRNSSLKLGTKVTLCVGIVQIPIFIIAAILHIQTIRDDFLETVKWRSQTIAQSLQGRVADLSSYSPKMQRTLGLNVDCQVLLDHNKNNGFKHIGVIGSDGKVIAHTDSELIGTVEHKGIWKKVAVSFTTTANLGKKAYDTLFPVFSKTESLPVAYIDIGFSRKNVDDKIRNAIIYTVGFFFTFLLLSFILISWLLRRYVTHPIVELSKAAVLLAGGDKETGAVNSKLDEVSLLQDSFQYMSDAIKKQINELNKEIYDRKEAEHMLSKSEKNLRVTLDSIGDAVIATDTQGLITRMNPVAEELTGWCYKDAVGKPLDDVFIIVNALNDEKVESPVKKVLATGEIVGLANHTALIAKDGTKIQIADSGAPIQDDSGNVAGVVLVFRDVTEEYALQERLRQSEKMDAIGQLAGGVAHDFNNVLAGILGAAELLGNYTSKEEKALKLHKMIIESVDRAAGLTQKLLIFARKQTTVSTSIDVHKYIDEAVALLDSTIDKRIKIEVNLVASNSTVIGDPSQLQSAFLNLAINASHAMPTGGVISIKSSNVTLDKVYCETSNFDIAPGPYIDIEIRDTGKGIDKQDLPRIFEPFFTTKEQGEGTGLGLAAVFGTVQEHCGVINVYSEIGKGTSFHIYFPLSESEAETVENNPILIHGEGNILLIEDEPGMRLTADMILKDLGYNVILAENGKEGLKIFKEAPDRYDLILLDMIMPEMNGSDCFYEIKKIRPDMKVILSSGFTREEELKEMKNKGLTAFVSKPFRSTEISQAVHNALCGS